MTEPETLPEPVRLAISGAQASVLQSLVEARNRAQQALEFALRVIVASGRETESPFHVESVTVDGPDPHILLRYMDA